MAEALISPGVFLRENDLSQVTAGPVTVGAALIGPTVVGRPNIPTLVTSYSQYKARFGTTFVSNSNTYEYLTSQAAYNYFQQGGTSLVDPIQQRLHPLSLVVLLARLLSYLKPFQ
jgi:hypothetical protein